ncbi:EAL domain-containing protein (putative c-di-GMP-specific phosphodiesterase class I) [Nonomuraea thailandensis]|uniref:EAL domain-containing protein (Putative c-di-GMP-specific phosphodiesterase class I) n=1 Tax=Nonomuraea thailandensis TaxID=1188745 RepID=A0A9X2JZV8_9ACTN|nr:EAL domain-containing protein (putative c-di-GMP-specific phosphodiesterase class I) [Nonomuraea thailandensis]
MPLWQEHHLYVSSLLTSPMVDLDTGAVIAHPAIVDPNGALRAAPLPMVLELPIRVVLSGAGALAPLHEALRRAGRHPREAILLLTGPCHEQDRPLLKVGLDGLRTIGYLLGFGDVGSGGAALDLITDSSPYLLALDPEVVARIPGDHRAIAVARAVVTLARGIGAHVMAPGVEREAQVATVRGLGVRLAHGPLLAPGPDGKVRVPLPVADESPASVMLGPRVQELLLPAVTLPVEAKAEEAVAAFGHEPTITSVILVDEFQRPRGSLDRSRFLLSFAARYGHALHGQKPAQRLADPPRTVPRTTPAIAAMQAAGRDAARVYDDLVVTDELNRCLGIVRVSDLIRQVSALRG